MMHVAYVGEGVGVFEYENNVCFVLCVCHRRSLIFVYNANYTDIAYRETLTFRRFEHLSIECMVYTIIFYTLCHLNTQSKHSKDLMPQFHSNICIEEG